MTSEIKELKELTKTLVQKEELLFKNEEKFKSLIESMPDVVFTVDPLGTITYMSKQTTLFGYVPEELTGKSFLDFVHPDSKDSIKEELKKQNENKQSPILVELKVICKNQTYKWVNINFSTTFDEDGKRLCSIGVCRDITEKLKFEQLLYRKCNLLQTMSDNMDALVWVKDLENRYLFASKLLCQKILGCACEEASGHTDAEIIKVYPEKQICQNGDVEDLTDEITKKENITCRFYEIFICNQIELWLDIKKTPLKNLGGELIGTVGVAFDITKDSADIKKNLQTRINNNLVKEIKQNAVYQLARV